MESLFDEDKNDLTHEYLARTDEVDSMMGICFRGMKHGEKGLLYTVVMLIFSGT